MFLASDNTSGACPEVMAAVQRANDGYARGYGADEIMARVTRHLRPGGYLFVGHSESMVVRHPDLAQIVPTVFKRCLNEYESCAVPCFGCR